MRFIFWKTAMLHQVPQAINRAARVMTLRHPNAVDVLLYRKTFTHDEDDTPDNPRTVGGMMTFGDEDLAEYEMRQVGAGKMLFLGRISGSDFAVNGLDFGENDVAAYIEPNDEDTFTVKNEDRVVWIGAGFAKHFQVLGTTSPIQMPLARVAVYHLQPLEQPYDFENGDMT